MTRLVSNKVLQEILEKTNSSTGMFIQRTYKNTLRNLLDIFGQLYCIDRNQNLIKVSCFYANQERAIARLQLGANMTLPVITISDTSTANSDDRRRYNPILIHEKYWQKRKNRAIRVLAMAPRPVDITYNINIWAKYNEDMDQLREQVFMLFNPDLEITTQVSNVTKAFLVSESDVQTGEVQDQQDRVLKKTITVKIETYVENPRFLYTSTGKIENVNYQIELTNEDLSTTTTDELGTVSVNVTESTSSPSSHTETCICSDCAIPLETIYGEQVSLPIVC